VRKPGGPVDIPARKTRALLALLARHPGPPLEREVLAANLWPDAGPPQARGSLRQALKQLRRALGTDAGAVRSEGAAVVLDAAVVTDVDFLKRLCAGQVDEPWAGELYLGNFLNDFTPPTETLEEWIGFDRSALRETALDALTRLAETSATDARACSAAVRGALRLLALDPLQEPVHRLLMRLYLAQGRRGDAAAQYRLCRGVLARELGVAPESETEALFRSLRGGDAPARPAERPAVAVLPFRSLGDGGGQDYFSAGLSEDIIAALTRWRSFPVIAGDAPGAHYRLEGSVRRQEQRVRIAVRLSNARTRAQLWAEHYDRELGDIFAVQDEITLSVAAAVVPELSRAELECGRAKRPEDLGAWDCVLRGMAKMRDRIPASHLAARALFRQALDIRPDYAEAHAGIATSYNMNILVGGEPNREAAARSALEAARRAVVLDPASAMAHQELSTACQWLGRIEEALAEIRIAVELNPYDAAGLHQLGNKSDLTGDPRGIGYMEKAHRLNPLEMQMHLRLAFLARGHVNAGNFADAEAAAWRAIRLRGDYAQGHYLLALGGLGHVADGHAAMARAEMLEPGLMAARRDWAPYRDPASNARLRAALARVEDG
jgi:DNA-binding SARP family transcriptional activator